MRPGWLLFWAFAGTTAGVLLIAWLGYVRFLAEPPIPPNPAPLPARVTTPLTPRLVVAVIDSLREDAANDPEVAPTMVRMANIGASGVNITPPMTMTTMSVLNLGTGMTPAISWAIKNFDAESFEDESVFSIMKDAGHRIALMGDASWMQLFGRHAGHTFTFDDAGFYKGIHGAVAANDREALNEAERILADPRWSVVVIHVSGSDKMAHRTGGHLREEDGSLSPYAQAVFALDRRLGELWDRFGADSTWLILSDHGCTLKGNHGGGWDAARRAPFAWAGPGIVPASRVEQPLNAVAPMLTALAGLRPPRTAEVAANFDLLSVSPEQRRALAAAHLAARNDFATRRRGASVDASGLEEANAAIRESEDRAWLEPIGLAVGLLLQLMVIWAAARLAGVGRPWAPALIWMVLVWPLLIWSDWQYRAVQTLGELLYTPSVFLIRSSALLAAVAVGGAAARWGRRLGLTWVIWAFVILTCGQITLQWPWGPIPDAYRTLVIGALGVATAYAFFRGHESRRAWSIGLAGAGALYCLVHSVIPDKYARLVESGWSTLVVDALMMLLLAALIMAALQERRDRRRVLLWAATGGLGIAAMIYHALSPAWLSRVVVLWAFGVCLYAARAGLSRLEARNLLFALALSLYRALGLDHRVLVVLGLTALVWFLSSMRSGPASPLTAPTIAGLVVVGQLSYFYEVGYLFSFSALDMSVAFAATRDAINLGEGFFFLMVQALGPWVILMAAAVYNRAINDDRRTLSAILVAVPGALIIQAWGATGGFAYELDNYWYTTHAVPLVLYSACNVLLIGVASLMSLLIPTTEGP